MEERINIIGKRVSGVRIPKTGVKTLIASIVFFAASIIGTAVGNSIDDLFALGIVGAIILIPCSAAWLIFCICMVCKGIPAKKNNAIKFPIPTIGLTSDGAIVLYDVKGRKDYLTDKILYVSAKHGKHSERVGNMINIYKHNYGKVTFRLQNSAGRTYCKSVDFVYEAETVANDIMKMLK